MKKIFTLIAAAFVALTASAFNEEWKPTADASSPVTLDHIKAVFKNNTSKGSTADAGSWTFTATDVRSDQNSMEVDFIPSVRGKLSIIFASKVANNKAFMMSDDLTATLISDPSVTIANGANAPEEIAADDGVYYILEAGKTYTFYVSGTKWRMRSFSFTDEGLPAPVDPVGPTGDKEKFEAVTFNGTEYVAADVFANATIAGGESVVKFGTASMDVVAVGGTTAKDVYQDAGTEFAGWTEWNDVKWDVKNQGDITFGYILGTGNPAMEFTAEEVLDEGARTGHYRPSYTFYTPDCGKMPVMGLYYKFTAKTAGDLKIYVWSNKGNRNTYLVDEATTKPVTYKAEGYINGQNDEEGKKKWLTTDEIAALSNPEKPYVIGAGNQPFWGTVNYTMSAGQTVWIFQDSSQIGFQGYEFTPSGESGIEEVVAASAAKVVKTIQNGKIVIMNGKNVYNVAGQLVK